MNLPDQNNIDTIHLQRLFDNMSECYKLFWLQAIVEEVISGKQCISFDDLINNMIADAWYMVTEYKLNLGPQDTLENLVIDVSKITKLKSSEKRETIISTIKACDDKLLKQRKQTLTYNVPYRLLAPFMPTVKGHVWDVPKQELVNIINSHENAIYQISSIAGLQSTIWIRDSWAQYIKDNCEVIMGWIQLNMILYLQRRNPSVPGIPNKLFPPQERKLQKVTKYWQSVLAVCNLRDIYGGIELIPQEISIDHFIPWSYVAHDELWNLSPTTRSINSQKSNHLPDWNSYFSHLCSIEYTAYQAIWQYDMVHKEFDKCAQEHINSTDTLHKLYRQGITKNEFDLNLESIIRPVYNAAQNLGFDCWRLE